MKLRLKSILITTAFTSLFLGNFDVNAMRQYTAQGSANTYAQVKNNPGLEAELQRKREAIARAIRSNPDNFRPKGYKPLEFIYEITKDGDFEYRIDTTNLEFMEDPGRVTNCLLKARSILGDTKSESRGNQKKALHTHLNEVVGIENTVSNSIDNLYTEYERIIGDATIDFETKLLQKATEINTASQAIRVEANRLQNLTAEIEVKGRSKKTIDALNAHKEALYNLLDKLALLTLLITQDLRNIVEHDLHNIRTNAIALKTGLIALYQSLVYIAYLRADILFGDLKGNVARECANAHVDDILSDLPPSVQFAMHTSLDDDFVRKFKVTLDKIRNEIPAGVVVNPDETIEFPRGYNVGADGIPAGGNEKLIPIPPAFRPHL